MTIETIWNIIYYCAYKIDYKLHMALRKISPIRFILRIPAVNRLLLRRGGAVEMIDEAVSNTFKDPRSGMSTIFASIVMQGIPFILLFGLHDFYFLIFNNSQMPAFEIYIYPLFVYGIISGCINYFLLYRKDKYLKYFKKFDKQPRSWKVKWACISFGVILFPILLLIGSFIAMR